MLSTYVVYVSFYPYLFSPFFFLCHFLSPALRTWRLGWQEVMSECLGSRPAWPYLFARTAWCLGLSSSSFVFRLSLLSLLCSCAHRWVPVSFPFTCACWGIARWVLLLLLLFFSYSFRFFCQFGFPCDDVASWSCCRLEFYKSRLSVCAVCRWLELGGYAQCDTGTTKCMRVGGLAWVQQ